MSEENKEIPNKKNTAKKIPLPKNTREVKSNIPKVETSEIISSTIIKLPKKLKLDLPIKENWENEMVSLGDLVRLKSKTDLSKLFISKNANPSRLLTTIQYETELEKLQIELVRLQRWTQENNKRIAIIFEGRDAAGKGGTIRRFTEHLNPRAIRVVALPKPTEEELGQWYFQRYIKQLPNKGEIVFFDRSWYNRAVVEPVNGFCTAHQYNMFMQQVNEFEHMLYEDGVIIIKFWFSISKEEQLLRFNSRSNNPLKQWKLSPVDMEAQDKWDTYTQYKEEMFAKTHTAFSPWIIVKANNKQRARLESIRHVLSVIAYHEGINTKTHLHPDPNIISRYHRKIVQVDN